MTMAQPKLEVGGKQVSEIYDDFLTTGMSSADAAILAGAYILETFGKTKRTFSYKQVFAEDEPACTLSFNRTFQHVDWIDGESVVQAEVTPGEEGFNSRFHMIENDFDTVKVDLANTFSCIASMRKEIFKRFEELKTEINRINSDVYECCNKPKDAFTLGSVGTAVATATYLGTAKLNDKHVSIWQTKEGMMMLPAVYTIGTEIMSDERVQKAGSVAKYFIDEPKVKSAFRNQTITKKKLVDNFGDAIMSNGRSLRENIAILPDNARYSKLDDVVDAIAEHEAAALRSRTGAEAAITEAFGLDARVESIENAPVDKFGALPGNVRNTLIRKGIDTMKKLSETSTAELAKTLKNEGIMVGDNVVADWRATARTLVKIR
jgi:hypothetical protein